MLPKGENCEMLVFKTLKEYSSEMNYMQQINHFKENIKKVKTNLNEVTQTNKTFNIKYCTVYCTQRTSKRSWFEKL